MTEPENPFDDDRAKAIEPPRAPRPDWLVGADEGASAEHERRDTPGVALPFKLRSASDRAADEPVDTPERPLAPRGPRPHAPAPAPPKPVAWTAAASSVPTLKAPPTAPAPTGPREGVEPKIGGAARAAGPPPSPKRAETPGEGLERRPMPDFDPAPSNEESTPAFPGEAGAAPGPRRPRPLEEPWWMILLDTLRSNRSVQIGIAGVIAVTLAAWLFWPRGEPGVSLHNLRRDPAKWDGHIVRVDGRVGDVFPMGDGYAFNLHQGRDTIVVFTRARKPVTRQSITVVGSVTTGFLDGEARQAIFEN